MLILFHSIFDIGKLEYKLVYKNLALLATTCLIITLVFIKYVCRSSQASCLKTPLSQKLSRGHVRLPGEMFPADVQCKLQFGPKSLHSILQSDQDICTDLHCTRDHYTWASHSALEGTLCGFGKVKRLVLWKPFQWKTF